MYRIAYLCSNLRRTGPTRQLLNILNHIDLRLFEPKVITLSEESSDSIYNEFVDQGIEIECLRLSRSMGWFAGSQKLGTWLRHSKTNLLHTQGIRADGLAVGVREQVKHLCTMRNDPKVDYPMKFGKVLGGLMSLRHLQILKRLNVVACSLHVEDQLRSYGISSVCIPNGVEEPQVDQSKKAVIRRKVRQQLGITEHTIVGVTVGSLIERKNLEFLIRGLNDLHVDQELVLIIVGDGPARPRLESIAAHRQRIRFVGTTHQVDQYLAAADVFISSSLSEGLPNAALEALAVGLPCMLSDIPAHAQLRAQADSVRLFDLGDSSSLVKTVVGHSSVTRARSNCPHTSLLPREFRANVMSKSYQNKYLEVLEAQ
jgi:glycosyltransferase involved in cell wall biosynthesis